MTDSEADDDGSGPDVDWWGIAITIAFLCPAFGVIRLIFEHPGWLAWITFAAIWVPTAHWVIPRVEAWVHRWRTERRNSITR
ncbi:hypothetical protein [Catellatospora sichuanensis]|uniref:hypothetical protein n=1 Tax=Catellatospora sichuanensis TaxID=1969805 RepID=UPI001182D55C|nr:hypothetical protein [Catellatospora sichuanensis]